MPPLTGKLQGSGTMRSQPGHKPESDAKEVPMRLTGPERYNLAFKEGSFTVWKENGEKGFAGIAASRGPKLYIIFNDLERPIYVGVTLQTLNSRLKQGFMAKGEHGYYGYAWRRNSNHVIIDVWKHEDPMPDNPIYDIETVEAEVVFLVRQAYQWPEHQTEIHFHPSYLEHRSAAARIADCYDGFQRPA